MQNATSTTARLTAFAEAAAVKKPDPAEAEFCILNSAF
jgi:hypothetical protein